MREINIDKNENNQRIDRFLKKYLDRASLGFIYKMLRKKNIKLNGKKARPEDMILEGDKIQLYLAEETIEKFISKKERPKSKLIPNIVYEDENIILINKPIGVLSHGSGSEFEENIVDSMIGYLIEKGDYVPRIEKTFSPSICNRLDRNTSGLVIGAKNYEALRIINETIRKQKIRRLYKAVVKGRLERDFEGESYLVKDQRKNKVKLVNSKEDGAKKILTRGKALKTSTMYSLLEIELITGRTHQIRAYLSSLGHPLIGDRKYGDPKTNNYFSTEYGLENQWLHAYRIDFNGLSGNLAYLNGKSFQADMRDKFLEIENDLFT